MDAPSDGLLIQLAIQGFFRGTVVSAVLIVLCTIVHFYMFVGLGHVLKKVRSKYQLKQMLILLFALFFAHSVHVWMFAGGYMALINVFHAGHFVTNMGHMFETSFVDALYYSIVTYTSLGFGDIVPVGATRLLTGVETLLGLLMIAWSASFTYLEMSKKFKG